MMPTDPTTTPTLDRTAPFPIDWNQWRYLWNLWRIEVDHHLRPSSYRFPSEKNLLADEVLGIWSVNGMPVELSEVTFPDFGARPRREDRRYVGVTFGEATRSNRAEIASTFAELEDMLGIKD